MDGAIGEEREALRLNPNDDAAHCSLGNALEQKGRHREALQEYHAAYVHNPKERDCQQAYERFLKKPLNQEQVFALLVGQVPSDRVTMLVEERGIDFEPTDDYLQEVRLAGGEDELISALKSAKVTKPATVDPAAQARQAEVRQHVARGAEFV